jgi:hypothetical protein
MQDLTEKWVFSDCQAAHSSELEIHSSLVCELVMWEKDFEAVKELFWVGRGVGGLQMQPQDIHSQDQEDCRCKGLATIPACYKECKRQSVMFHHGQSLYHSTLMEGPRT